MTNETIGTSTTVAIDATPEEGGPPEAMNLEQALAKTESDVAGCLKGAKTVTAALKRFHHAAQTGDLRSMNKAAEEAQQAAELLRRQIASARDGWCFDSDGYLADGSYTRELLAAARLGGLQMEERDDRLYCYPMLLRVRAGERAVSIDRVLERRLRPSFLVAHLKQWQRRPPRFKPEVFLQALYEAYQLEVRAHPAAGAAPVIKLLDLYRMLTLLPGQARDYSRQEFTRDIYLLDQSGVTRTKTGTIASFPASTGTRAAGHTLTVVTQTGEVKKYWGISFTPAPRA